MLIYQLQQEKYSPTLFISLLYSYRDFFSLITVAWHKGKRAMPVVRKSGFKYWFCSFLTVGPWGSQLTWASSKCELCELKSTIHTLGIMAIIGKCTVKKRKTMNWLSTSLVTTKTLFLILKYTHSVVKLTIRTHGFFTESLGLPTSLCWSWLVMIIYQFTSHIWSSNQKRLPPIHMYLGPFSMCCAIFYLDIGL